MPFDSPDINLGNLLDDVRVGKVQLPDFQREWKWDTDRIASLLASISLGYPVGVLMMLEAGGEEVRFKPRAIAGTSAADIGEAGMLLLDGQQRTTSLYQSLKSGSPVATRDEKNRKLERWYYIAIDRALDLNADREEAIVALPADRRLTSDFGRTVDADYSTIESECDAEMFPLDRSLDVGLLMEWQNTYIERVQPESETAQARFKRFYDDVLKNFVQYTVPVIVLKRDTPKEAVCTVFEKVNTGGVVLNVFELLTATFASDDFRLNDDWKKRADRLHKKPVLTRVESTDFLQAVSLISTFEKRRALVEAAGGEASGAPAVSCRRRDILRLTLADYTGHADQITEAFEWAAQFVGFEKIFRADDVPYRTQLVPLAALRVILGSATDDWASREKLRQWFWCGVLGELYGGSTETRFARDVEQVPAWVDGGEVPRSVTEASFDASRLETLKTRNSAAYKGVYALLLKGGAHDWMRALEIDMAAFFDLSIDIHHIFPRKWCDDHDIPAGRRDSVVNKTPLSWDTNRSIGGRAPSRYLATVQSRNDFSDDAMKNMLNLHLVDFETLQKDDFDAFYQDRRDKLVGLIEAAMGKEVRRDDHEPQASPEYEEEAVAPDAEEEVAAALQAEDDDQEPATIA